MRLTDTGRRAGAFSSCAHFADNGSTSRLSQSVRSSVQPWFAARINQQTQERGNRAAEKKTKGNRKSKQETHREKWNKRACRNSQIRSRSHGNCRLSSRKARQDDHHNVHDHRPDTRLCHGVVVRTDRNVGAFRSSAARRSPEQAFHAGGGTPACAEIAEDDVATRPPRKFTTSKPTWPAKVPPGNAAAQPAAQVMLEDKKKEGKIGKRIGPARRRHT